MHLIIISSFSPLVSSALMSASHYVFTMSAVFQSCLCAALLTTKAAEVSAIFLISLSWQIIGLHSFSLEKYYENSQLPHLSRCIPLFFCLCL